MALKVSVKFPDVSQPPPSRQMYRVKTDREIVEQQIAVPGHGQFWQPGREVNWRQNLPAVFWLFGGSSVDINKRLQELIMALNPSISGKKLRRVYDYRRAFTNGLNFGFDTRDDPTSPYVPHADYFNNIDLGSSLPRHDKIRVCANATVAGVETYSIMQALRDTYTLLRRTVTAPRSLMGNFQSSVKSLVSNNMLIVDTLTPNNIPTLAEIQKTPWLFFEAVSSTPTGDTTPFPQGDGNPVWIPLIARTEVRFPLAALERV